MVFNIGIIGVGGVGGYFGGKLCRSLAAPDFHHFFIARGQHLKEIQKKGLTVGAASEGEWVCQPTLATDCFDDLPLLDLCLVCVKSYDLKNVVLQLASKLTADSLVLAPLNGIDIYQRVRDLLPTAKVFPSSVYVGTHIECPGKVAQKGGACKILMGPDPQNPDWIPHSLFDLLTASQIRYEWCENIESELWSKYLFIASFGLVSAFSGKTLGEIIDSKSLRNTVVSVMQEIVALARQKGVALPDTAIEDAWEKSRSFPYETKTSFQRDFECANKADERDLFGETILRLGEQEGIPTPVTRELHEELLLRKPSLSTV